MSATAREALDRMSAAQYVLEMSCIVGVAPRGGGAVLPRGPPPRR
ncbi:hypothetical protein QJS66_07675 [Kocuria rhizophila]|nr:hypothetical protein QJS66_07675 [Kocuria rhizophila]